MLHARVPGALEQVAGVAGVVAVVLQRIGDRLGHDGVGREVHDGVHIVLGEQTADQFPIARVAHHQGPVGDRLAEALDQVVEHDDPLAALPKLFHHVAADVAGAAGDQYRSVAHFVTILRPQALAREAHANRNRLSLE